MAFSGYLMKLGGSDGTELPMEFIKAQSYNVEPARHKENKTNGAAASEYCIAYVRENRIRHAAADQ